MDLYVHSGRFERSLTLSNYNRKITIPEFVVTKGNKSFKSAAVMNLDYNKANTQRENEGYYFKVSKLKNVTFASSSNQLNNIEKEKES